jgi:hypothetical protein
MGFLSGLVNGLGQARIGYNAGNQQHAAAQGAAAQAEQEQKMAMLKLALEESAKARQQQNADRSFGLEQNKFQWEQNKPLPPRNIDPLSPEGQQAKLKEIETAAKIAARYRESPGAGSIALEQWRLKNGLVGGTTTLPDGTVIQTGGKTKAPTDTQKKNAIYYGQAADAEPLIDGMDVTMDDKVAGMVPFFGNKILSKTNPKYQAAKSAADRFVEAYLRPASGANVPEHEREAAYNMFIPAYGDSPEKKAQKKAARATFLNDLKGMTPEGGIQLAPQPSKPAAIDPYEAYGLIRPGKKK